MLLLPCESQTKDSQTSASHGTRDKRWLWQEECGTCIHSHSLSIETGVKQLDRPRGSRMKQEMWQNHKTWERKAKAVKNMTEPAIGLRKLQRNYKSKNYMENKTKKRLLNASKMQMRPRNPQGAAGPFTKSRCFSWKKKKNLN